MPLEYRVILVLKDRRRNEQLAERLLTLGYRPLVLDHPRQALEAACLHDCCAAILSDNLPEIPGVSLARMLQARISDLAILMVSSSAEVSELEREDAAESCEKRAVTDMAVAPRPDCWLHEPSLGEIAACLEELVEHLPAAPETSNGSSASPGTYGIYFG